MACSPTACEMKNDFGNGGIDPRQYLVYNLSSLDLTRYTLTLGYTPHSCPHGGNDMQSYLFF